MRDNIIVMYYFSPAPQAGVGMIWSFDANLGSRIYLLPFSFFGNETSLRDVCPGKVVIMVKVLIIGAGKTGTVLAKELARFVETHQKTHLETIEILVFDEKKVTASDLKEGFYLPEDRGFEKGETVAMVLAATYPDLSIKGFSNLETDQCLGTDTLGYKSYERNHLIICDCSAGKAKNQILEQFLVLKMMYDITGFFPCEDGLYSLNVLKNEKRIRKMKEISEKFPLMETSDSLKRRTAYTMLGNIIRILKSKGIEKTILWDSMDPLNYLASPRGTLPDSFQHAYLPFAGRKADIICVGAGGTGGNIVKELIPLMLRNEGLSLTIIDGDRVEEKNLERQAFSQGDILAFKSQALADKIKKAYPMLEKRVFAVTEYIDIVDQIPQARQYPILIGAVDNHRARQIFVQWFQMQKDGVWIDAANEFEYGEVVVSIRAAGKNISPLRSDLFPEVLTDSSPSASELSCGAVNKTSPQHQLTNLVAAGTVMTVLEEAFEEGRIQGGIIYFDALAKNGVYSKRQPLYTKEVKMYANA